MMYTCIESSSDEEDTDEDDSDDYGYGSDDEDQLHGPCGLKLARSDFNDWECLIGKSIAKEFLPAYGDLMELYTGKIMFQGNSNNMMLKLIQEVKGKMPHKLIRKGTFSELHFDPDYDFLSKERDKVRLAGMFAPRDSCTPRASRRRHGCAQLYMISTASP